ncbi:ParB/RepB/Spo0J family partition protein [Streptomyces sp. NPDC047981]|uniref:ParB/RepB/Spo0J family partition protein n=1 Tax=Streptomyces sp. NPDC047981 TaxID=3154610 RepID=UPI00341EFB33
MPRNKAGGSGNTSMTDVPLRTAAAPRKADPKSIVANPRNLRDGDLWEDEQDHQQMVASVRSETGLIQALVVCTRAAFLAEYPTYAEQLGSAEYVILAGHRRHAAVLQVGLDEVRIDVRDDQVPNMDLLMLEENLKRKTLSVFQEGEGYRRIEARGVSHSDIAKTVGRSKSHITKRITLLNLPEDAKEALLGKRLTIDNAYNLYSALDGENLHLLLEANELLRQDRTLKASDAVNAVLSGSARTAAAREETPAVQGSASGTVSAGSLGSTATAVLAEPEEDAELVPAEPPVVPDARAEAVLTEPVPPIAQSTAAAPSDQLTAQDKERVGRGYASARRHEFCVALLRDYTDPAIDARSVRVAETALRQATPAAVDKAHRWMAETDADAQEFSASSYRDAVLVRGDATLTSRLAYAVALAESEVRASNRARNWDSRDIAHLQHLVDAGYDPTPWDSRHLG